MNIYPYIKGNHKRVLKYILTWIQSSKPPKTKIIDNNIYYWFSLQKIAEDLMLSYYQVKTTLYRLENKDKKIDYADAEPFIYSQMVYSRSETNKLYLRLNLRKVQELFGKAREDEMVEPLFEVEESKPKVNEMADKIARKILEKNSDIFKTKSGNTKTYYNCCKIITDIYSGNFTNPRIYNLSKINDCKWFDTDGWKSKLKEVKCDWGKVRKLFLDSVDNYRQMFDKNNMPQKKDRLPDSLEKWLYDSFNDLYPSYFVFSFNPPNITQKQYGENRADTIFKLLPRKMQEAGNILVETLPKGTYPSVLWNNILNMYCWAKYLVEADNNSMYWLNDSSDILNKFITYCNDKDIEINLSTINIERAVECNSPWVWFVREASIKHGLNINLCDCVDKKDFEKLYKKKIIFELVA
jgi:hypothetical protein